MFRVLGIYNFELHYKIDAHSLTTQLPLTLYILPVFKVYILSPQKMSRNTVAPLGIYFGLCQISVGYQISVVLEGKFLEVDKRGI